MRGAQKKTRVCCQVVQLSRAEAKARNRYLAAERACTMAREVAAHLEKRGYENVEVVMEW